MAKMWKLLPWRHAKTRSEQFWIFNVKRLVRRSWKLWKVNGIDSNGNLFFEQQLSSTTCAFPLATTARFDQKQSACASFHSLTAIYFTIFLSQETNKKKTRNNPIDFLADRAMPTKKPAKDIVQKSCVSLLSLWMLNQAENFKKKETKLKRDFISSNELPECFASNLGSFADCEKWPSMNLKSRNCCW